jgi:hypothetical protein
MFHNNEQMQTSLETCFNIQSGEVTALSKNAPAWNTQIDVIARNAIFNPDASIRAQIRRTIHSAALQQGIQSRSLSSPLQELANGRLHDRCFLTIRLGGHCYDLARLVLRAALEEGTKLIIFEQGWTGQSIAEFTALMEVAALREGWSDPLYLRAGLHPMTTDTLPDASSTEAICDSIDRAVAAGVCNFQLRISTQAMRNATTRKNLAGLFQYISEATGEAHSCSSLVLASAGEEPNFETIAELSRKLQEDLSDAKASPKILGLPSEHKAIVLSSAFKGLFDLGFLGCSIGGQSPTEVHECLALSGSRTPLLERRVDLDWAKRIVMHSEFSAAKRREILEWLAAKSKTSFDDKAEFIHRHEYETLGHFDFEIWNLETMPQMRAELMEELRPLLRRACGR